MTDLKKNEILKMKKNTVFFRVPHQGQTNTSLNNSVADSQIKKFSEEFGFNYIRRINSGHMSLDGDHDAYYITEHELKKDNKLISCYTVDNLEYEDNLLTKYLRYSTGKYAWEVAPFIISFKSSDAEVFLDSLGKEKFTFLF